MKSQKAASTVERASSPSCGSLIAAGIAWCLLVLGVPFPSCCGDLKEVQEKGVLFHLGVPYANFVTGGGDGLDVDLMKLFARFLGVEYRFVRSSWEDVIPDLVGNRFSFEGDQMLPVAEVPVKGDVIANGMTLLPQREQVVAFSTPTFVTQVWLLARHDSSLMPIPPSGDTERDIATVKALLKGHGVLGIPNTCLEPQLYRLSETGANVRCFSGNLNELAPAIISGEAELTLLDVPDAIIALEKWPGKLKVIGPISPVQKMACAFPKTSKDLLERFNAFFEQVKRDGAYMGLVRKYYPTAPSHFPEFFSEFQTSR
ncbi:MAG: transporter substrate-binding domain-containing protein [Syntrophobacteraceae bacterium]